jgi:hypothetical protein
MPERVKKQQLSSVKQKTNVWIHSGASEHEDGNIMLAQRPRECPSSAWLGQLLAAIGPINSTCRNMLVDGLGQSDCGRHV